MPLLDHFRPPLDDETSWEGFHAQWPAVIVQHLKEKLPSRFVPSPRVHLGAQVEIDVATFDQESKTGGESFSDAEGGVATAVWAPAKASLSLATHPLDSDEYEVRVYDTMRKRRLVAAIEIVSPGNKDRPEKRRQFVAKCAGLLAQQVSVVIVDLVTTRQHNLYAELLDFLAWEDPSLGDKPPGLYVTSSRTNWQGKTHLFESWNEPLELGKPLPTVPLWLTESLAIPLELEASYTKACSDLSIG